MTAMREGSLYAHDLCNAQFHICKPEHLPLISPMRTSQQPLSSISVQYAARIAAGLIEPDVGQETVVRTLALLETELASRRLARKSSSLGWLFASQARAQPPIKGAYIFGDVGRGKTMLMDMFFDASRVMRKR